MYKSKKDEDKSIILSITRFCFKWKQSKHTWMLLYLSYLEQEESGIDRCCGFIFTFIT